MRGFSWGIGKGKMGWDGEWRRDEKGWGFWMGIHTGLILILGVLQLLHRRLRVLILGGVRICISPVCSHLSHFVYDRPRFHVEEKVWLLTCICEICRVVC